MYVPFCFVWLKATVSENKENLLIGHCSKVGGAVNHGTFQF